MGRPLRFFLLVFHLLWRHTSLIIWNLTLLASLSKRPTLQILYNIHLLLKASTNIFILPVGQDVKKKNILEKISLEDKRKSLMSYIHRLVQKRHTFMMTGIANRLTTVEIKMKLQPHCAHTQTHTHVAFR